MPELIDQNAESIQQLVVRLKSARRPIAFLGAGVSVGAKFPSWKALMTNMHKKVLEKVSKNHDRNSLNVSPKYLKQLEKDEDYPWRAQEYKRMLGNSYFKILDEIFSSKGKYPSPLAEIIAKSRFSHMVTTNYDLSFEKALRKRRGEKNVKTIDWALDDDVKSFIRDLTTEGKTTYCVYLHGQYPNSSRFIVANNDYIQRYSSTDWTTKKLFAIFLTQTIVFIGYSLNDPDLTHLLRIANSHLPADSPNHFIFLPLESDQEEKLLFNKYRALFGITPIFYRKTADHSELLNLLEEIERAVSGTSKMSIPESTKVSITHPDDPHKGKFGGKNEKSGFRLSATVEGDKTSEWFWVTLKVDGIKLDSKKAVTFFLHDSFVPSKIVVNVEKGKASHGFWSYGAFTVGALVDSKSKKSDGSPVRLELDLSELPDAPNLFRMR